MTTRVDASPFADPAEALRDITESGIMCFDLETTGLDPITDRIGVVIVGTEHAVYLLRQPPEWMPKVLADPGIRKVGFNLKFDLSFLLAHYGDFLVRNVRDLYLEELLLSERRQGQRHDLATVLNRRLGIQIAKGIDHEQVDWTGDLSADMVRYAREDVEKLPLLDAEMDRQLALTYQTQAAEIENNAVLATAYMGLNGVGVDRPAWEAAIADWDAHADDLYTQLTTLIPEPVNWNAPAQVVAALNTFLGPSAKPIENARKETLRDRVGTHPIFEVLLEYKHYSKRGQNWGRTNWDLLSDAEAEGLRTYLATVPWGRRDYVRGPGKNLGYLDKFIHPVTGRIHPSWWQIGADTCRYSCSAPNLQQLPHDDAFRRLVRAQPGNVLVSIDFQQIEVLTAAVVANDRTMLKNFIDGVDTHAAAVNLVTGIAVEDVTKDQRQLGKAINFGLQFAGGAQMLSNYARVSYGVQNFSVDDAKQAIRDYFNHYTGLARKRQEAYDWAERTKKTGLGEIRNLVNMRRIVSGPQIKPTTYLNTIIQSSAGHGIKAALYRAQTQKLLPYLCAQIHDELLWEFPKDRAEELANLAERCMRVGMQDVLGTNVPVRCDIQIGETWAG